MALHLPSRGERPPIPEHEVLGVVHVIRPAAGQVADSLREETNRCGALRIVIDLRSAGPLEPAVDELIDVTGATHPERLQVVLPPDVPSGLVARVEQVSGSVRQLPDD